jgi:hypothetical protein
MVQEEWLAFYSSNTKIQLTTHGLHYQRIPPPCAKVTLDWKCLTELATYNINTRSNILMKCSKAKIKNKLQDGVWHI